MANQSNRFPYSGGNARESSSQQHTQNAFPTAKWQTNPIWGNHVASSLNNRESASLRGQDESFTNSHQGSSTFPTSSDASDVWAQQAGPWSNADNNAAIRKASSSPSPARPRDSANDLSGGISAASSFLAAIGQTHTLPNSWSKTNGSAADTGASSFKYASSLRDSIADDGKDATGVSSSYSHFGFDNEALPSRTRAVQDSSNSFTTVSAAVSVSGSTASASAASGPTNGSANANSGTSGVPSFGSFGAISASHHGHSHRPSLQASTSYSSPAAPASALPYHRNSQPEDANTLAMAQMLHQQLTLEERVADSTMNAHGSVFSAAMAAYPQASGTAPFQLNPVSESWNAGVRASGYDAFTQGGQQAMDPVTAAALAATRGSLGSIDRGNTPIGSSFRQVSSPRSLGTPANATGPWSRPPSRDPRTSGLSDGGAGGASNPLQRQPLQNFLHDQQLATASLGGNPSFFANNIGSYPLFNNYRAQMQMSPLGIPIGAPIGNSYRSSHMHPPRDRDPARSLRSPLLDEFRSSRTNRRYELKDIYNHIVEFSGDQHGSRFIQSKLETANSDEKEHVFLEISVNTLVLMRDVFGNYVVQKFFEHGSQVQKKYLAEQMRGKMIDLSMQTYSCRVVQKALQYILVDQQVLLTKELEADVLRVVKDANGNHVIQKVIELVPREHIGFIMDAFRGRVRELSSHNYGCRVVQRILEHGSEEDKLTILSELHENTQDLIKDQYGNYVAQHVIEYGEPEDRAKMINKVLDELVPMSRHKFASNVVEKCIEHGTPADRCRIREELDKVGSDGVPVLQSMIKDQYGNYVIQKLLKQLKGEEHRLFVEALSTQLGILKRVSTARQNAAIDRLAVVVDELSKGSQAGQASTAAKSRADSTAPASPQLQGDHESTPSLTNAPNTPESSNPPSVSAGPTGNASAAKTDDTAASVSSDANTQTAD